MPVIGLWACIVVMPPEKPEVAPWLSQETLISFVPIGIIGGPLIGIIVVITGIVKRNRGK